MHARSPDSMLRLRILVFLTLPFLLLPGVVAQTGEDPIISALRDQQFDKALALLHTALIQLPDDAQLWTMQGVANDGAGNKKKRSCPSGMRSGSPRTTFPLFREPPRSNSMPGTPPESRCSSTSSAWTPTT